MVDAIKYGEKITAETLQSADNYEDVVGILGEHARVKSNLNTDAMEEIQPYLEQGV